MEGLSAQFSRLFDVHKNTVHAWVKQGLQPNDAQRPALFHGPVLVAFLQRRRESAMQPWPPGHIYCLPEREADRERLDRRADAMFNFVKSLADGGDEKAATFLNKLLGGGFDWPQDEPGKTDDAKRGNGS
jgi:hypothetical protein